MDCLYGLVYVSLITFFKYLCVKMVPNIPDIVNTIPTMTSAACTPVDNTIKIRNLVSNHLKENPQNILRKQK